MQKQLSFKQKYDIIGNKLTQYEGVFITAVKTTGIFCRPSCHARKPNMENVEFYDDVQQALQAGFRPCKTCKPMEKMDSTPGYIKTIIKDLHSNPYLRIKDQDLKQQGLEPSHIRRWFKTHHNMTFQSYQRLLRINAAFNSIKTGTSITNSAFASGYESLSGFNDSYKSIFGDSASQAKDKVIINIVRLTSPIGPMFACASTQGVCLLDFTDRKILEAEFQDLCKRLNAVILPGTNSHLELLQTQLTEYFAAKRQSFSVLLHFPSTDFRQSVWQGLQAIPYAETRSYKQQAHALGNPKAVRAVAAANGQNRINILIPCHRVIGADGSLTGYGGGLYRKQWLLDFERDNTQIPI
ncbi:MAG: methylated-DNA--[protein]-cysteine S-methyltransferase [Proteobacteria bacterium]|nr:methylated-DNA--[protein]-cysteine S-methyltransferase [Pseudomonadota bacterium]